MRKNKFHKSYLKTFGKNIPAPIKGSIITLHIIIQIETILTFLSFMLDKFFSITPKQKQRNKYKN